MGKERRGNPLPSERRRDEAMIGVPVGKGRRARGVRGFGGEKQDLPGVGTEK